MNVYDFDGTIYDGDSTLDFYRHCLRCRASLCTSLLPNALNALLFKLGLIKRQEFKQRFFRSFIPKIDVDACVSTFWKAHRKKVKSWYYETHLANDLIASASPNFLLQPICNTLEAELLATQVNYITGVIEGANLRGRNKLIAFQEHYPNISPEAFYTDDPDADAAMIEFAQTAFLVEGDTIRQIK